MTTTVTSVASTTSPVSLIASSGARISLILENNDANRLYVLIGSGTVSASNYTFSLVEGASATVSAPEVYEAFSGVWAADGSGACQITSTVSDTGISGDSTTLGDLKELIASDLERTLTDTSHAALSRTWDDEIGQAIGDAVSLYKSKHWWFLQEPTATAQTSTCSTTTSYVSEPTGLIQLDSLRVTANSQRYEVKPVSFSEMEILHDGATTDTGQPYMYNRYGSRLRLYPSPDQAYTLTWSGLFDQASLTSDAISNDWMTHGRLVIKAMAKLILLRDYIKSYEDVPAAQEAVMVAERALDREHMRRTGTRRLAARS